MIEKNDMNVRFHFHSHDLLRGIHLFSQGARNFIILIKYQRELLNTLLNAIEFSISFKARTIIHEEIYALIKNS